MRWYLAVFLAVFPFLVLNASPAGPQAAGGQPLEDAFAPFAKLLERHLIERDLPGGGLVSAFDYEAARSDPETRSLLDAQTRRMAVFDRSTLDDRERAIAFWLNAYNYFMLAHILDNPRRGRLVDSVRDFGHLLNPYRVFRQGLFDIGGQRFSLDEMEKGILLGDDFRSQGWKDARVHFAVNCASVGCPPLRQQIYLPQNVDALLAENTRRALKTDRHFRLDGDTLYLSQLFEWYEDDYVEENGSVTSFLQAHGDEEVRDAVDRAHRIRFIDYDWDLNRPENFPELAD
jgi:hypothetical protein